MAIDFTGGTELIQTTGVFNELNVATVALWVFPTILSGNKRILGTDSAWEARFSGTSLLHEFRQSTQPHVSTVFATHQWYHLAFTFDGTNKGVYVNGSPDPVFGPYTNGTTGFDTALSIGGATWNPSQSFSGYIEDVRIYNRILSQKEVEQIYNSDGCDCLLNGLHHWWRLDNGVEGHVFSYEPDVISKVDMTVIHGTPTYIRSHRCFNR